MMTTPASPRSGAGRSSHRAGRRADTSTAQSVAAGLRERLAQPELLTDLIQIIKSVLAGSAAWWLSVALLDSQMPFMAPWSALLTVHATVHRSVTRGVQTTVSSAVGVGLSFLVGYYLGVSLWTYAAALFIGLVAARLPWIRDEGVAIATTAVFVLSSGFEGQTPLLLERIMEVALGVGAGIVVNLLVLPPLRDGQARRYVDSVNQRVGDVLVDMAEEFTESWDTDQAERWFAETEAITRELHSAWTVARFARESRRGNPRGRFPRPITGSRDVGQKSWDPAEASYEEILERLDEGVSHLRHLARTLREAAYSDSEWDERFRRRWVQVVDAAGRAIADPDAEVASLHDRLTSLSSEMSDEGDLPAEFWPTYGSLITSLRHIVVVVDDVASAREARREQD